MPASAPADLLALLRDVNRKAAFNLWCGIEVLTAETGRVEIGLAWKRDLGQYSGFLHAGVVGALIDTACGYAAATVAGTNLLAAHFSVNCLRPAAGDTFTARARVVKAGKLQVFTACELLATSGAEQKLVATGETLLTVLSGGGSG